jgi:hypothetical protein
MTGQEIVDCALREGRHIPRWLAQAIDDAIAVGRGKELEACASLASSKDEGHGDGCEACEQAQDIAREIRARRTP